MIYNVVLVSGVQLYIYIYLFISDSFPLESLIKYCI